MICSLQGPHTTHTRARTHARTHACMHACTHAQTHVGQHRRLEPAHIHDQANTLHARRGHPTNIVLHVVRNKPDTLVARGLVGPPLPALEVRDGQALPRAPPLLHGRPHVRRMQRRACSPKRRASLGARAESAHKARAERSEVGGSEDQRIGVDSCDGRSAGLSGVVDSGVSGVTANTSASRE